MLKLSGNTEKERGAIKTNRLLAKNDAVPNSVQKSPSRDRSYLCRSQSRVEGVESLRCSRRCSAKIDYGQKRLTNSQQEAGNGSGWRCICSFLAISPYKVAHINKYSQMHCGTVSIVRVLVWAKDWDRASACGMQHLRISEQLLWATDNRRAPATATWTPATCIEYHQHFQQSTDEKRKWKVNIGHTICTIPKRLGDDAKANRIRSWKGMEDLVGSSY